VPMTPLARRCGGIYGRMIGDKSACGGFFMDPRDVNSETVFLRVICCDIVLHAGDRCDRYTRILRCFVSRLNRRETPKTALRCSEICIFAAILRCLIRRNRIGIRLLDVRLIETRESFPKQAIKHRVHQIGS